MIKIKRKQNISRRNIAKHRYKKLAKDRMRKMVLENQFFWLGILIFIILIGLCVWVIFGPVFQVKEIKVSGNQEVSEDDVLNMINRQIDKKILLWESRSIFLVSIEKITENILAEFPKIERISLKRKLPSILLVKVKERKPVAIYCPVRSKSPEATAVPPRAERTSNGVAQAEDCFFIDKTGIIFKKAYEYENYLIICSVDALGAAGLGEKAIEQTELGAILKIKEEVQNNLKIPLKEAEITNSKLTIKTIDSWEIYFNTGEDINWQITELKAVLEKEIPPENREDLEYIDLRFSRVYYKYR